MTFWDHQRLQIHPKPINTAPPFTKQPLKPPIALTQTTSNMKRSMASHVSPPVLRSAPVPGTKTRTTTTKTSTWTRCTSLQRRSASGRCLVMGQNEWSSVGFGNKVLVFSWLGALFFSPVLTGTFYRNSLPRTLTVSKEVLPQNISKTRHLAKLAGSKARITYASVDVGGNSSGTSWWSQSSVKPWRPRASFIGLRWDASDGRSFYLVF